MSHKLLFEMRCLDLGILPQHIFCEKGNDSFEGIDKDDRRKMCRKFRKLRRKLQKKSKKRIKSSDVFHHIKMEIWTKMTE